MKKRIGTALLALSLALGLLTGAALAADGGRGDGKGERYADAAGRSAGAALTVDQAAGGGYPEILIQPTPKNPAVQVEQPDRAAYQWYQITEDGEILLEDQTRASLFAGPGQYLCRVTWAEWGRTLTSGVVAIADSSYGIFGQVKDAGGSNRTPSTHRIETPESIPGGEIEVSLSNAPKRSTITVTATPDKGYTIGIVTVVEDDGRAVPLAGKSGGRFTFLMPAGKVFVNARFVKIDTGYQDCARDSSCPAAAYTDLSPRAWYHDGMHYCLEKGLVGGYEGGWFDPSGETSRAMVATMLWRMEGCPIAGGAVPFTDVAEDAWCAGAIRWAASESVAGGFSDGTFRPDSPVTREQLAAMLYRYKQYKGGGFKGMWNFPLRFDDAGEVSPWAREALCWMTMKGVVSGRDGNLLDPQGKATRAQAAVMLMRFCITDK